MRPRSDQQGLLADAAERFVARNASSARLRACRDRVPDFDPDSWGQMADLGWLAVRMPESEGGLDGGLCEMGQLVYRFGASGAPEPLVATGVLASILLQYSHGPACRTLLDACRQGLAMPAVAFAEPGAKAERAARGWIVHGSARFVVPADAGDLLWVFPEGSGLPSLRISPAAPGCEVKRERRVDGSAALRMTLRAVEVGDDAVVSEAGEAWAIAEQARDAALVMTAVQMSGTMLTLNRMTQDYLRTRVQFGKPIGSFQALQHEAVDMYVAEQLARDVAQDACATIDAGCTASERACVASRAKAQACESIDRIARAAVQLHGAIGFTDEFDLSLHVNRALVLSAWLGNAQEHVRRYARHARTFEAAQA